MNKISAFVYATLEFVDYCCSFYDKNDPDPVYPIATRAEIEDAVVWYLTAGVQKWEVNFDSIDREAIGNYLRKKLK